MSAPDSTALDRAVLDELLASVGHDRDFVRQLIDAYVTDSAELVAAVEAAVAADDAAALVRPAHTLKSSSATVGAARLSALARELEAAGRAGDLDPAARDQAARARDEWTTATAALRIWTDEATG